MPGIIAREDESVDSALRRFRRVTEKAGVLKRVRDTEYFTKPAKKRQRTIAAAKKRHQKKLARERAMWESLQGYISTKRGSSSGSKGKGKGGRGKR